MLSFSLSFLFHSFTDFVIYSLYSILDVSLSSSNPASVLLFKEMETISIKEEISSYVVTTCCYNITLAHFIVIVQVRIIIIETPV